jgi:hypothetical protein
VTKAHFVIPIEYAVFAEVWTDSTIRIGAIVAVRCFDFESDGATNIVDNKGTSIYARQLIIIKTIIVKTIIDGDFSVPAGASRGGIEEESRRNVSGKAASGNGGGF